jgi:hypothetical protein
MRGFNLTLNGDLTLNGSFDLYDGRVFLAGSATRQIAGSGTFVFRPSGFSTAVRSGDLLIGKDVSILALAKGMGDIGGAIGTSRLNNGGLVAARGAGALIVLWNPRNLQSGVLEAADGGILALDGAYSTDDISVGTLRNSSGHVFFQVSPVGVMEPFGFRHKGASRFSA